MNLRAAAALALFGVGGGILRVAVQATNPGASGMVTHTVDVPSYEPAVRRVPFEIVK